MMNKTEKMAFHILKKRYNLKDIWINSNKSPDFVCSNGDRFEVKKINNGTIRFSDVQLKRLKPNDIIMVFDDKNLILEFFWKNRHKVTDKIKIDYFKGIKINIEYETLLKLKKVKEHPRETYNEVLIRLLDD